MRDSFLLVGNVVATIALIAFILVYARVYWWKNEYGRSIMSMKLAVLCLAIGTLFRRGGDEDMAISIIMVGWWMIAIVMIWRTSMLWKNQSDRRKQWETWQAKEDNKNEKPK